MAVLTREEFYRKRKEEDAVAARAAARVQGGSRSPASVNVDSGTVSINRDLTDRLTYEEFATLRDAGVGADEISKWAKERRESTDMAEERALRGQAQKSVMAYDGSGRLSPWQTALNLASDARSFNQAAQDAKSEEEKQREAEEREKYLHPKTAEEAKEVYGLGYDLKQSKFLSWLLGHPVYTPAKGVSIGEIHGAEKGASASEVASAIKKNLSGQAQTVKKNVQSTAQQIASGEGRKTGNPTLDNWGVNMRENAAAARTLAERGVSTYGLSDSLTRQTTDEYQGRYAGMGYGKKLGHNIPLTAANYLLDIANAGITSADALSGGKLGSGSSKASSIFKLANFAQNAGSGLTREAYASMRESTNWLGGLVLDLERTTVEQLLDRAAGSGSLAVMGVRVFGSGAQEAEDRGEGLMQQIKTAGARGAVEIGTELLGGVGGSWRGTGYGDAFLGKLDKWVASKTGSELLGTLANAFTGEALEEMIADVLNPIMDRILGIGEATGRGEDKPFMQKLGDFLTDVWGDGQLLYDGLLGGLAGLGGGAVTQAGYSITAKNLAVDVATYKAAQRIVTNDALKAKFEELTGQKLSTDEQAALLQTALYLVNVSETTEGNPNARQVETDLMRGTADKQSASFAVAGVSANQLQSNVKAAFTESGLEISGREAKMLSDAYIPQVSGEDRFIYGMREAYQYGAKGFTLAQTFANAEFAKDLAPTQVRLAWTLGGGIQTVKSGSVDTKTTEGKERALAELGALGKHAEAALKAYDGEADISGYAGAMNKAAALYAASGADLKAIVQAARNGEAQDIVGSLTDAQVETAMKIGAEIRAERQAAVKASAARIREIKAQASGAQALAETNKALTEARAFAKSEQAEADRLQKEADDLIAADEVPDNAEEIWNRATEAAREHRKNADTARETVKELEAKRQQLQSKEPGKRKKGTVSFDGVDQAQLSRKQKNVVAMVQALADAVNIDYVIFSGDARGNQGAYRNGTVYLNINAGEAGNKVLAAATLSHELTHYMQQYAPEEYAELKDFIVREILKKDAKQFAALVTRQTNLEPGLSYDQAEDEVIANACQTMLLDSKAIAKLARQNMSLAEKIADVIEDITAKIKAAFEDVSMESIGFRDAVKAVEGELEQIQALWDKGIEAATENYNAAQTVRGRAENKQEPASKQTENAAGVQYQKHDDGQTKSIKQQIQAHAAELNRKPVVSSVRVSDMPTKDIQKQRRWIEARLRNTGYAVDRKGLGRIEFTPSQINTGLNYLDEPGEIAAFATLPAVLKRGDIIDRHEEHKGRQRGSVTIAAPVEINGVRGNMAVALTQTGKTHYHAHRIVMPDGSTFIFANENDAEPKPAGELPAKQALIAEPISSTSDTNIADASGKGKTKFQKFDTEGKVLTARQADFFTDSKIRDANGKLKVMYRGGDGDFTVFDRRMASYSNLYGRGFYFTESREHAQHYGRARAFYLNITSPLQAGSKTFTRQQIRSYLEAVAENEDYGLDNYGREATVDSVLRSLWGKDDFGILTDINASCIGDMVAAVELFNEINGTSYDGIVVPTETVAFRPEQIKLTDNANPTEHEDVRYQMWDDSPVENVSDKLVAVHNVSEEKLLGALKLGGLPMPSIAIVKAKTGHSMYGPISLVFGKDSIDPRADRRNKVYGSDAWTPTGVRIDYQLDSGKLGDFEDRLHELSQKVAGGVFSSASAIRAESIDTTTTHDLESAVEKLAKNETVLAAYAAEHGIDIPPVYQVKTYSSYGNETLQTYIDRIGTEKLAQLHEQFMSGAWDVSPGDMAEIKAVLVEKFMSQKGFNSKPVTQERAEKRASLVEKDDRAIKFIEDAYRMQTDENKTGEEVDRWRTLDAMKERLSNADVKGWVREAMSGVYQGSGIYNGKESYYPDGRRRTFKQTHDAVTLANIVKNMSRNQEAKGQGAHFGATGIQSITSQDFQSVEEMRQASGRLARLSEEEYSAAVKAVDEKLENLVNDIADSNKDNTYLAREIVREAILETARGRRTVAAIQKFFGEETVYRISAEQAETLIGLFHEAANLPTEYFEAKPQRAVGFDEVRAAVIPDNSTDGLRNALSSAGVPTVEYTTGDEDARLRAVQSVPETQFQRWDEERNNVSVADSIILENAERNFNHLLEVSGYDLRKGSHWRSNNDGERARLQRIEGTFLAPTVKSTENRDEYCEAVRRAGGIEKKKVSIGYDQATISIIDKSFYTAEMLYAEAANKERDLSTQFFIDEIVDEYGEKWLVNGYADTDEGVVYVKYNAKNGKDTSVKSVRRFNTPVDAKYEGVQTAAKTSRHERFHLIEEFHGDKTAQTLTAFVDDPKSDYAKLFETVNYWYQVHLNQEGYGYSDYSHEIAADLYAGTLILANEQAQEKVSEIIAEIDKGYQKAILPKSEYQREKWAEMRHEIESGALKFQKWDVTTDDTAAERNGRELAYTRLQSENKILSDTIKALNKVISKKDNTIEKLQTRLHLTKTQEVRTSDARKLARTLLRENSSSADVAEITAKIKALGDYIVQSDTVTGEEVKSRARSIAAEILEQASEQVEMEDEQLATIRDSIKGRKLTISPDFFGELDGGFDTFRKGLFGKFTLARADSTSIDRSEYTSVSQFYADMQSEYGQAYFPDAANEGEEATILANVMQAASPMEVNPYEQYMGEATEELANRIAMNALGGVLRVNPPTDADRAKARRVELQQHILQLKKEQKIADREAGSLYQTVYDLSLALDQAESRYKSLRIAGDQRVEQVRAEGAARALEIKAKERAKAVENIADLKEHYKEIQRNARERRENTGKRHKIRRLIDELNARLKNPTEKRHIPRELVQQTIDVLSMIDLDNGRSVSLTEKLAAIRTMYEGYQNDPTYSIVYDDVTAEMLKNLAATVGNTKLLNMSQAQLDAVYDTLKSLNHVIHDSINVKIGNEERSAYELSREMTEETRQIPKAQRGWVKGKYLPAHLRADVAFRRFAGFKKNSAWEAMCRVLNDGQLRQTELKMQLCIPFAELVQDEKGISNFTGVNKFGKIDKSKLVDIGLKDENGDAILVTHDIMTGIYLDLLNEDNRRHFIRGGKTIPNLQEFYDGKGGFGIGARRAVGISEQLSDLYGERREAESANYGDWSEDAQARIDELESEGEKYAREVKAAIEKNMTDFDRQWVKATQRLMDTDSKRLLNEVTMEVYGIKKARVEHYFPITTDPNFLRGTSFDSITRNMSLENAGFMKERVPASNPTLALGVAGVVNNQINRVSQYCGLMPAIRNFNKVYNKVGAGYSDSLRNAVNGVFGKEGLRYIENLIADLTGSRAAKDDVMGLSKILGVLRGNLAQSTLTLNPRVALAQAASYPTAAAELGYGPLAKAFFSGGKSGRMISRADTELIAKYSPLLWYRMQGYSSPELGDIKSSDRLSSKVFKKLRWFTGWIQAVDGATVGRLWYASEYWVQDHKPALQKGTDAYYEAVAEKFNAVVEKTQPNYTPMQRAAILREPDNLIRTLTMFMTQRLQNFNILYDSTAAYQKARADFASKRNGVTQADVKEAKTQMVNAVTSQFAQAAVFTAFKFFADALLHRLDDYRDDETGEITAESVSLRLLNNYVDAFIGAFLLGSELYGIIKGITGLDKWYGLSLSGVDSINDIIDSTVKLAGGNYDMSTEEGRIKFGKALWKLVKNLSTGLGIPTTNAEKMYNAVRYHVEDMANGEALSFEAGFDRTTEQRAEKLILALESGDMAAIQETAGVFESEKAAVAAIKKKLSKDVKAGDRTAEDAQRILVLAGQGEDAAYWATLGMEGEDKYTEIKAAVLAGDKDAIKDEREQLTTHGVKDSAIETAVKTFIRKAFLGLELSDKEAEILGDTKITAADAEKMLTQFLGVDRADAADLVDGWKFEQANGYSYGDRKEKYIDGEISASELKKALMSQGGKTAEEADKIISGYDFEKRHGWSWDDRKRIYQKGKVSSADMSRLLMEREGMTAQQAAAQLQVWDWAKEIDGAENVTVSAIEKYNAHCAGAGVSKESFVSVWTFKNNTHADVDANGEAITNSLTKKVMAQISTMQIPAAQKTALALCFYAQSTVNKYKLW